MFEFENDKTKKGFSNLIDNLSTVKPNGWFELLYSKEKLYGSASIGRNDSYIVLISKIIYEYSNYESVLKQYESYFELYDEETLVRGTFNKELKVLGFESTRRESGSVWFAKFA